MPVQESTNGKVGYKTDIPTGELGSLTGIPLQGLMSWAAMGAWTGNDREYVPELMWPNSVRSYQLMRNDTQVDGLTQGVLIPIQRWDFGLDPNNADPVGLRELSRDLGLPIAERNGDSWRIAEAPVPLSQGRFNFQEHLAGLLLATMYGHQYFEQVADLVVPPADWPVDTPARARLRKLAERPPWTLSQIDTAKDGGLEGVKQFVASLDKGIGVDRLVAYIWGKEGANWVGRSMLRSSFRPWLVKDRVIRVGAINIERAGAGTPVITAPPGATEDQIMWLNDLARRYRSGDTAGAAVPYGSSFDLVMAGGRGRDIVVDFLNWLDQQMANGFLQMFQQLGQTQTGSRALGGTFLDFFTWVLEAIADWLCSIFTTHVIEDWWRWNFPALDDPNADEYAPRLVYVPKGTATDPLASSIDNGQVAVDDKARAMVTGEERRRNAFQTSRRAAGGQGAGPERQERAVAGDVGETSPVPLPARPLRRQPMDFEIAAAVDFANMDADWNLRRDALVRDVAAAQQPQIAQLHDLIVESDLDLATLAEVQAEPVAEDLIFAAMVEMANNGARAAHAEALAQGASPTLPDLATMQPRLRERARAIDRVLANSISQAARTNAIRIAQGTMSAVDVARDVKEHLQGLSDAYLKDQLGNAVTAAQNTGRSEVMRISDPTRIYSSEILDDRTCALCIGVDGTEYPDLAAAEADYPGGGFKDCLGGGRCRGTLIAVYGEKVATIE